MRRAAAFIKKYWKTFDDSLINPPKERNETRNFKGQAIPKKILGQGPTPTPEQTLYRTIIMEDEQIKMQPRTIRAKNWMFMLGFVVWYVGVNLFIMYRMKGDDLDSLEK